MGFVLRMAAREARASWRRLIFFFFCVALGVGAIVGLRSVIQAVRAGVTREAQALIAGDVLVQVNRPLDPRDRERLEAVYRQHKVSLRTESMETPTMVHPADPAKQVARMVELKAVQPGWPLYGSVELEGGRRYTHDLLKGRGAVVRPELLSHLDVKVGDGIVIGSSTFVIRGVLLSEPGRRLGFFNLGPRVVIDLADVPDTGLISLGSRARFITMLKVPDAWIEPLVRAVRSQFGNQFVSARSYRGAEDDIGEDLARAENYLSLVGFIIVVLGGIGVWSVTRVFVRQKIKSIAVLKCVGATTGQVLAVYVAQVALLGLVGSALGIALAAIGIQFVPTKVTAALGDIRPATTVSAAAQGLGVGLLVSLLFSLVPLLDVRRVRPLLLLREDVGSQERSQARRGLRSRLPAIDWLKVFAGCAVVAALVAVASWQAASLRVGVLVCGGFVAVAIVLHAAGALLVRLTAPLARVSWFPLRHAVLSFSRPGNQTRVVLMAVGLGVFFIVGVRALQVNLQREFSLDLRSGGPDLFLIDIQPDQVDAMRTFLQTANPGREARFIPTLRARVISVHGSNVVLETFEDVRGQGGLSREFVITYRDHLEANERIVDGRFWGSGTASEAEVSIEDSIRERYGIGVGDRMTFDVLGRIINARVSSVRQVEWADARSGGFMFVFRPGIFDKAPRTFIATLTGPGDVEARGRLQRDLVARFSNVSAIDIQEITRTVEAVLDNVSLGISIVGAVALVSGVLILVGSVAMTKFQRLREAAIFKTLGASSRTIAAMLALEYTTLGVLAGAVGSIGAIGLSWIVCRLLLDITWRPVPMASAVGMLVTAVSVGLVGVLSSLDVLRRRPLATLRAE